MEEIFARHLPLIGKDGIRRLLNSKVLVAGAGGLGTVVLQILVRTGVGKIYIVDHGIVDEPDLNRQILYNRGDIGEAKVDVVIRELNKIRDVDLIGIKCTIDENFEIPEDVDIVVDCLDNFYGKFLLNDLALKKDKPLVHAGISGFYGQVTTIIPKETLSLRDMLRGALIEKRGGLPVIAASSFSLGTIEASETIKYLIGKGTLLKNRILVVDVLHNDFQIIEIASS
ncbi:MAG TPA: HesA/MoeB/ThiF family protein [Candidatus Hydrothermia bacterium]|nr:HesA/MoeB/ThiF family protein [Candidatus Hydrothermia bacterium]